MQRLTGLDATFLYLETPSSHMHVASTAVFDPRDVPGGYSFEKVKAMVLNRLPLLPPFRRRLVEIPFSLHHPLWIEDPDFDIDFHVRRAALPAPGGAAELAEFAGDVMARPLHRGRPLWEMYVIEGLEGGYIASITKTHHAAIDGVSGAELTANLLDLSADTMVLDPADDTWQADRIPSDAELVGFAVQSLSRQPLAAAKAVRRTVEAGLNLRRRNREPDTAPPPAPFSAPPTSINTSITPHRKFAFTQMSLDDVKHVKNSLGGTVNDIVLAMCAGALRRYFDERGEVLEGPLVGMIPISVRAEGEQGAMGNRVSSMLVSLASDIDDPIERLAAIRNATKNAKEQDKAIGADTLTNWAEFAAPAIAARAARLYSNMKIADRHRPLFNVTISNVPGPPFPLYCAGARLVALYPMGPIMEGGALNMTVMSYMDTMNFGLVACAETIPNVESIARYLDDSLDELMKLANAKEAPAKAAKAAKKPAAKKVAAAPAE